MTTILDNDELEMFISRDDAAIRGASGFRSVLERLENSFLPRPTEVCATDRRTHAVSSYLDLDIGKMLDRKKHFVELIDPQEKLNVGITQERDRSLVGIHIPSSFAAKISPADLRQLFIDLVALLGSPTYGFCHLGRHRRALHNAAYAQAFRTFYASGLYWLNFFGPDEEARQGGSALANNPLARVERLPQGLLIQVGDDPLQAATPEGEQQLKAATAAMPSLEQDQEVPKELVNIGGVKGFLDQNKQFWISKHLDVDTRLDAKTITKFMRVIGKGDPPVEQINILFSRKETAERNSDSLAAAGLGAWYVDLETGESRKV